MRFTGTSEKLVTVLKQEVVFIRLIVLAFLFFGFIGILHHEMWRDELQAWLIAKDSSSISHLFENLRYEGHPGLWHLGLYVLTRFTHNPLSMQIFHLLIATSVIYVFVNFSPFTRLQKFLFSFSYFPFYEYSLISRNYSLGVLLIFCFCTLFTKNYKNYFLISIIIALLANTNAYGLILATCLGMTAIIDIFYKKYSPKTWSLILSLLIFCFGITSSIIQLNTPTDGFKGKLEYTKAGATATFFYLREIKQLFASLKIVWYSYFPLPNFFKLEFWNSNIVMAFPQPSLIAFCLSCIVLILAITCFIRKPIVLFLYSFGTLGIILFTYKVYTGSLRHYGHLFILLIACLWIAKSYSDSKITTFSDKYLFLAKERYRNQGLTILLCAHLMAGIFAYSIDLAKPFSLSKAAANYIKDNQLNQLVIVGTKDHIVSPISAWLDQKIYYPESRNFGSFIVWNRQRAKQNKKLDATINQLLAQQNTNILLVASRKINTTLNYDFKIDEIVSFSQGIVGDEKYNLYLIERRETSTATQNSPFKKPIK